jgi:hypothetical protein
LEIEGSLGLKGADCQKEEDPKVEYMFFHRLAGDSWFNLGKTWDCANKREVFRNRKISKGTFFMMLGIQAESFARFQIFRKGVLSNLNEYNYFFEFDDSGNPLR